MSQVRGFKFVTILVFEFQKKMIWKIHNNFYSNSKAEAIISVSNNDDAFESICSSIISNIQKSLGKGLGWIADSVFDSNINIS